MNSLVVRLDRLPAEATPIAGGKGASLGRMMQFGLPVPQGFIVCASAFRAFLEAHNGAGRIVELAGGLDTSDDAQLDEVSREIREFILSRQAPAEIERPVLDGYGAMGLTAPVAVRSSAVSEDGDTASFAGQQETYLNVCGGTEVLRRVKDCWASFFTPRALFYRAQKGALTDIGMAVVVQEMVQADKSGVMFTVDPVHRRRDHLVIEAANGLGEAVVSGEVTPDHYVLDRDDGSLVREFIPPLPGRDGRVLTQAELAALREMGLRVESFFGKPQDVEWCIRGPELLLLQSRPITTL
jgi:pyruvate,water dikinase